MMVCTTFCRTLGFVFLILMGSARQGTALTVNTLVDEQDGSVTDGDVSLRDALSLAPAGDTITFSVRGTIRLTRGQLNITKPVIISGPGRTLLTIDASGNDPTPTTRNGDGSRIFFIYDNTITTQTVQVNGLLLRGGDSSGNGGAILNLENVAVVNCEVSDNHSQLSGGAIYSGTNFRMDDSSVFRNTAVIDGGGFFVNSISELTNVYARGNRALTGRGGGVHATYNSLLRVIRGAISENQAALGGGGIYVQGSFVNESSLFVGNLSLDSAGGAIQLDRSAGASVSFGTFRGNRAKQGGAIYTADSNSPLFEGNTFNFNQATFGGGLFLKGQTGTLRNNIFNACTSTDSGGAAVVQTSEGNSIYLQGGEFNANTADVNAGALLIQGRAISIRQGTKFVGNNARYKGGALFGPARISDAVFTENVSGSTGGAVQFYGGTINLCRFERNNAVNGTGGAIGTSGSPITITNSTFTGNLARQGGGLFVETNHLVSLTGNVFSSNVAGSSGRDAYVDGTLRITSTTISDVTGPGVIVRN